MVECPHCKRILTVTIEVPGEGFIVRWCGYADCGAFYDGKVWRKPKGG